MRSLSSPIIRPVRNPSALQLIRWTLMKLAKQLFLFYGWAGLPDSVGGRERQKESGREREKENAREGEIFSCKAQGCKGLDFPKFLIKAHHLPSFLCSFHHDGAINLSSLFVCHSAVVNLITCSCEGCWEGEMEWGRRKEREWERGEGRGDGLKKGGSKKNTGSCLV